MRHFPLFISASRCVTAWALRLAVTIAERVLRQRWVEKGLGLSSFKPVPMVAVAVALTEMEFDILNEVGAENGNSVEQVIHRMVDEYIELRAEHPEWFLDTVKTRRVRLK